MDQIGCNQGMRIRRTTLQGREYLVAPLTLIVPGVLNGSQGPLLYPPEEIERSVDDWNHIPIVVEHPVSSNGEPVSARDPDILAKQGIGVVLRAKVRNGKLKAEGWFDVESTRRVDSRILDALRAGRPIELSTGLYTDKEPVSDDSVYNGRPYRAIARNYRPDHLAILFDATGACSVRDGCGVNVNTVHGEHKMSKLTPEQRKTIIDNLVTCNECGWGEEDREVLNSFDDKKLLTIENCRKLLKDKVSNKADEPPTEKDKVSNKADEPLTEEQLMAKMPPEMKKDLEFARAEKAKQKEAVIESLTANITDEAAKSALVEQLKGKPLDELRALLALVPTQRSSADYSGQAVGAPTTNKTKLTYVGLPGEMYAGYKA